jgi:alpha-amylase/alpha-mannosidase (GH57 family)
MTQKDSDMKKHFYLCVHGHFYQPPRENPWLEIIELQRSAAPYHDWNERITRECYGPNTRARLHGNNGRIAKLINNYEYMSFDFGPTLLSWLDIKHPWIYSQILAADKASQKRYNGHGNALAHVYNHIIMPLATRRDKLTQIRWGLADFRHRFARDAEGMWLAETAVDTETLELMADEGIRFTVLSPAQASAIRPIGTRSGDSEGIISKDREKQAGWMDVSGGLIDPTRPYRVFLNRACSKYIDIFFYDGPLSRSIAYEKILSSGEALIGRINSILENHKDGPRILGIATDGESYGHHFKFGEMALSWLFNHVEKEGKIDLINFGAFLELFPPKHEVRIIEKSSWSCAHGVERWRSDCGCSVNGDKECNQHWRTPLRNGLEWLSGELALIFEKRAARLLKNPWEARDEYINIILDESQKASFFQRHSSRPLKDNEKSDALCLLESQRMALYMFTSCGWFFDDISGIESIQILMYALRAIELVRRSSPNDLENGLINFLVTAESNDASYKNGANIFEDMVKPSKITPSLAAAHYAMMSLVKGIKHEKNPFSVTALPIRRNLYEKDEIRAALGEVNILETRTDKSVLKRYFVVCKKDQEFSCVIGNISAPDYDLINDEMAKAFLESPESLITVFSMMAQDVQYFSPEDLIPDARLALVDGMAGSFYARIKRDMESNGEFFNDFINLLRLVKEQPPSFLHDIFRLMLIYRFYGILAGTAHDEEIDFKSLLDTPGLLQTDSPQIKPEDGNSLLFKEIMTEPSMKKNAQEFLIKNMKSFAESNKSVTIQNAVNFLKITVSQGIELELWECQNIFYDIYSGYRLAETDNPGIFSKLIELGSLLGFVLEEK